MLCGTLGLFAWKLEADGLAGARTLAFTGLVLFELFNAFNCRSLGEPLSRVGLFSNRYLIVGLAAAFLLQLSAIYLPPMQQMFSTVPLGPWDWLALLFVAPWIIVAAELQKHFVAHRRPSKAATSD
jgi:Ca2+-transporting ATPase